MTDPNFGELSPRQREFLSDIRDSGEHLLALINDILDLSKIEAGKLEVHRLDCDVDELIKDSVTMLRPQAEKKKLNVQMRGAVSGAAHVDPRLMRQVLVNLLSNAVKFTDEGRIEITARFEGNDLVVRVTDTGIGISEEDQEKIFHEFYQADGSFARRYQGTGLGLALVRRMMSLHGGSVTVTSQRGHGSTFQCLFPDARARRLAPATVAALAGAPSRSAPIPLASSDAPRGTTVLVVEDNPVNRKLARNVLRSRGYRVLEADTGEEGIEVARAERPHLILMDLQLPGLDGIEATRRLKADPHTRDIPIVALSAYAQEADQQRAREAGCAGYIAKPIRLSRFPQQVGSYLGSKEGAA